jgi:hypothetical protein
MQRYTLAAILDLRANMNSPSGRRCCEMLIDWFWRHGHERKGQDALLGRWLDELYTIQQTELAIETRGTSAKPSVAIWGPSQSGKSTLIASYIDAGASSDGSNSALHWSEPARFSLSSNNDGPENERGDLLVLNPYNGGRDASGCVSRFSLAENVLDTAHPVELRLAGTTQVMHALAMGYLSECETFVKGKRTNLNDKSFQEKLDPWNRETTKSDGVDRKAYQFLHEFAALFDTLIGSGLDRYENLLPARVSTRRQLMECRGLLKRPEEVWKLAADILWDNQTPLTTLFNKLVAKRCELQQLFGGRRVYCSMRVARTILNISAYQKALTESQIGSGSQEWLPAVQQLSYQVHDDRITLGVGLSQKLIKTLEDFALLQALVLEMVIPLRGDILRKNAPVFYEFLQVADLVDFPGVAREEGAQAAQVGVDLATIEQRPADLPKLFTDVLKRGKTASIVTSYAKNLAIDGFVLTNKAIDFSVNSKQLKTGIYCWWKSVDPEYDPSRGGKSPLPFNFMLTFCAPLLSDVVSNSADSILAENFTKYQRLGLLAAPEVVTHTLATNYEQFRDGRLDHDQERRLHALEAIQLHPSFLQRFPDEISRDSFQAAITIGGTDFAFNVLKNQAINSPLKPLLAKLQRSLQSSFDLLLVEAAPHGGDSAEMRKRALLDWHRILNELLRTSKKDRPAEHISSLLRRMFLVDANELEPLPRELRLEAKARQYIDEQLGVWLESRANDRLLEIHGGDLGIQDSSHLRRLLQIWVDAIDRDPIVDWLQANFGNLTARNVRNSRRRFFALRLSNELQSVGREVVRESAHRTNTEIETQVAELFQADWGVGQNDLQSYHYIAVVQPFLRTLEVLAMQSPPGTRERQPGDDEIVALFKDHPRMQSTVGSKHGI